MANLIKWKASGLKFTGKYTPLPEGCPGECLDVDVVVQGKTLEETRNRLQEAVKFHPVVFGPEELAQ